jgi:hypothetical protein
MRVTKSNAPRIGSARTCVRPAAANRASSVHRQPTGRRSKWDLTSSGAVKSNYKNALIAVHAIGVHVRRDTFSDVVLIENQQGYSTLAHDQQGNLRDTTTYVLRKHIQDVFGFDVGVDNLASAIMAHAEDNRFNPVVEWLDGLHWDGTPRLATWLPSIVGCENDELNRAIGSLLITGMVARARYPGTKFDYCIVFEGPQGCGKSTLVRMLATGPGEAYFTDAPGLVGMDNKERAELIGGKWVVELAELSGLARTEAEAVKAFLTQVSDRFRAPYARAAVDRPRCCVFVGTTNAKTYLSDNSGNRRFLPVACGNIALSLFNDLRIQLIAEADHHLSKACKAAHDAGIAIIPGKPLPTSFADQHIALPAELRRLAADMVDVRRHTDTLEEAVCAVMQGNGVIAKKLPDGRTFVASKDILIALRLHLGANVSGSGLSGWMAKLGWESSYEGRKDARVRGYAKRVAVPEASGIPTGEQGEQGEQQV